MSGPVVHAGPSVRAPASSANLGPGFDTLGLALDLPFEVHITSPGSTGQVAGDGSFHVAGPSHPAHVAFTAAGGAADTTLSWRSPIPPGRGLGFSGAARVAGAYLAATSAGADDDEARSLAFSVAAELEGHADNAAASTYGGLCVAGGFGAVGVPVPDGTMEDLRVIAWSPEATTSTRSARSRMPSDVPLRVAVGSIERTALWVAAMSGGRTDLLREACIDELHQPARLHDVPDSAVILEELLRDQRVLAAWLSGSGPSVAALVAEDDSPLVVDTIASRPRGGRTRVLRIDHEGVGVIAPVANGSPDGDDPERLQRP